MKQMVSLSDETHKRLVRHMAKRYAGKRGGISIVVELALREYLDRAELVEKLETPEFKRREREDMERLRRLAERYKRRMA